MMFDEQVGFLRTFLENGVAFLVYGGYAVIHHGYKRTTGDIDIWLSPTEENKTIFLKALSGLGFENDTLNYVEKLDFSKPQHFVYGEPPLQFDFANFIQGVSFDEAFIIRSTFQIKDLSIPILSLEHLILSKISSDRLKDKSDIEELQRIHKTLGD